MGQRLQQLCAPRHQEKPVTAPSEFSRDGLADA
jgi:hypothetical protein